MLDSCSKYDEQGYSCILYFETQSVYLRGFTEN